MNAYGIDAVGRDKLGIIINARLKTGMPYADRNAQVWVDSSSADGVIMIEICICPLNIPFVRSLFGSWLN